MSQNRPPSDRSIWVPLWFCSFLCLMTIIGSLAVQFVSGKGSPLPIVFLAFLPMCFNLVCRQQAWLREENDRLRAAVEALQGSHRT